MKAVIWTDVAQVIVEPDRKREATLGFMLCHSVPGGWSESEPSSRGFRQQAPILDFSMHLAI